MSLGAGVGAGAAVGAGEEPPPPHPVRKSAPVNANAPKELLVPLARAAEKVLLIPTDPDIHKRLHTLVGQSVGKSTLVWTNWYS